MYKVGDVLSICESKGHKYYVTVIHLCDHGGFYYYTSSDIGDFTGREDMSVFHSNMFLSATIKVVGHKDLEVKSYESYSWTITGIDCVDSELPNLDSRYRLFSDKASKYLKSKYDRQEDNNYHRENAHMVREFAKKLTVSQKIN